VKKNDEFFWFFSEEVAEEIAFFSEEVAVFSGRGRLREKSLVSEEEEETSFFLSRSPALSLFSLSDLSVVLISIDNTVFLLLPQAQIDLDRVTQRKITQNEMALPAPTPPTVTMMPPPDRKPRVLQEFVVMELPADHPSRNQHEGAVPPGVEEDAETNANATPRIKERHQPSTSLSSFLDPTPPPSSRLSETAIERASAGLKPGDKAGAEVLREVFGDKLPWAEMELFGGGK